MKRLVIGILAHVDSGKTTLSEEILFHTGKIRRKGRVDHKDSFLDSHDIERDRGITIFSSQAVFGYGDCEFTLLDTPGHVDFSTETERTLRVLDYAILVISGTDGVQSHTETLWKLLSDYNIPVFIFINKMDISSYDKNVIIKNLKSRLNDGCIDFSRERDDAVSEELAMCDEALMDSFLEGKDFSDEHVKRAIKNRRIFPCYFGSALKSDGVDKLLDGINTFADEPERHSSFGAKVFKISQDEQGERLTHMKITGGTLKVKDTVSHKGGNSEYSEKINQVRIYSGDGFKMVSEAFCGSVCTVTGLKGTYPGEGIGAEPNSDEAVLEPVLNYRVVLPSGCDVHNALADFRTLEDEDPQLHVSWNEQLREINVSIMGEVQLEVLKRIAMERFNMNIEFDSGSIAYKETISDKVEGVGHYEPLRHYAEVHLILEPGERGSGLVFNADCPENMLDANFQRLVLTHLKEKTHLGVLTGSPVTDMKITLTAGRSHLKHTEGGDFRQATYRAVRQGLMQAKSVLLEPWYKFRLELPSVNVGRAMTDSQQMGGNINPPETSGEFSILTGDVPTSSMQGYQNELNGYTKGKGRLSCMLKGYDICHNADEVISDIAYNAESDLDNTADSVFCAHGAGFNVKWDSVKEHMHLDSTLDNDNDDDEPTVNRVERYLSKIASDDELMAIFENTYGAIKRPKYGALKTKKEPIPNKPKKYKSHAVGKEYLLIDGYNIIFAWENLRKMAKENLDLARNSLVNTICNYQGFKEIEVILVFDAYKVKRNAGEIEKIHDVSIVYTKEAETADMYIEKVSKELGKTNRVKVATSDGLEQLIILGSGAIRVTAEELKKEIEETEKEIRNFLKKY